MNTKAIYTVHENGKEHYFFWNMQEGSVTLLQ
jgi:hypothetical protein